MVGSEAVAYDRFSKLETVSKQPEFYGRSRKRGHEETSEHTIGRVTTARSTKIYKEITILLIYVTQMPPI